MVTGGQWQWLFLYFQHHIETNKKIKIDADEIKKRLTNENEVSFSQELVSERS